MGVDEKQGADLPLENIRYRAARCLAALAPLEGVWPSLGVLFFQEDGSRGEVARCLHH